MSRKIYNDLSKDALVRLLEALDRQAATRFGLVWEADEIERVRAQSPVRASLCVMALAQR